MLKWYPVEAAKRAESNVYFEESRRVTTKAKNAATKMPEIRTASSRRAGAAPRLHQLATTARATLEARMDREGESAEHANVAQAETTSEPRTRAGDLGRLQHLLRCRHAENGL